MYLKRLELLGFKSFLSKTSFDFGPGVTAVIGPNGSGKSNVAESLRWVLGEQTARNVRARRLEDVIFSGSSQKAAVGMAEVAITLDNSEGWLPVDFSEVVVSRRAYRNGESEYLINKSKVRLRDVLDLFMRAQVGQNSYAFLGQGLVEEVLVMRPEERRRLLEEAADVRLLRTRLDEARDRLAATRENLERVNLLIEEIGPRLLQLERQAARAADQERLALELAAALQALYGNLWSSSQEAVAAAMAAADQRQQAFTLAAAEVKACEEGLQALVAAVEERQKELTTRRLRQRDLSDQIHGLQQRTAFDRERIDTHGQRRKEIETELAAFKAERADAVHAIDDARQRESALLPEIEEARSLIQTRRQELNGLEQEYSGLRRRVADHEDRITRGQRLVEEADAGLRRLNEDEAKVGADAARRAVRKRDLIAQLKTYGREFRDMQQRLIEIEDEVAEAQQERTGLVNMIESGRGVTFGLESESVDLGVRLAQVQARHDVLRRLEASHEGIDTGVRMLLGDPANPAQPAVEGLLGLVREIIRVPPGLEHAIEAALAENVQALAFENLATAVAAIDLLQRTEGGRVLLYPLDGLRPAAPVNILRERGVIGVAAKLVRCENRFRALVDTLLGRTIVVETLALAQQVVKRGMGSVVTMDGTLLRPGGAISGGLSRAATESFGRQRELEELPVEYGKLQARKTEVDNKLRREKESLAGASAELTSLEPQLAALRDEASRRGADIIQSSARLVLLQSQAKALWAEWWRGEGIDTDWRERREALMAAREANATEVRIAGEDLAREREALASLAGHRNAALDSMSGAAAAQADLEGEARSLSRQAEMLQANLSRSEAQIKGREAALTTIQAESVTLTEKIAAQGQELAALEQEMANLTAEMEPAEGELEHLTTRERSMREQLNAARIRLFETERGHMEAEGLLKIRRDEVESLLETMQTEGFRPEGNDIVRIGATTPSTGRIPPVRGGAGTSTNALRERIGAIRQQIRALGPVNEQAPADYIESKERYDFLKTQVEDLEGSEKTLLSAIEELEANIRERLKATFAVVDREFQRYFESFFSGGRAHLSMTMPEDYANSGLEIVAQPPGKRVNNIAMLSGGERALTSVALLLALLNANPSPVCVLDEVDAALDEANVGRFVEALKAMAEKTQFIVITHNPRTIEAADVIYGVSMGTDNTSRVLSVRLGDPMPQ